MSELPATREYEAHRERNFLLHGAFGIKYVRESTADAMRDELLARIVELEAELAAERRRGHPHDAGCECPDCDPAYDHCDLQDLL